MNSEPSTQLEHCAEAARRLAGGGYTPLVARVLAARGISEPDDISFDICNLPGVDGGEAARAAGLMAELVKEDRKWCILGDYDADGMCAVALSVLALDALGVEAGWLLSHRDHEHRSMDPVLVRKAREMGADVIVSVDGGTDSHEGVRLAKELGMTVVVTDHHPPPASWSKPDADALVNPHIEGNGLPSKGLCGTTVMLALVRELFRRTGTRQRASRFIDIAAIATMSDVMPMDDRVNRSIVMAGVEAIRRGRCRPVIKEMLDGKNAGCCPSDLNFRIGPLLNSAHRMSSAEIGVNALLAEDIYSARSIADELRTLNRNRRLQSAMIADEAVAQLDGSDPRGAVAFKAGWNVSMLGLVAGNLVDRLGVPVAVLTEHLGRVRGSMRSTQGVSLLEVIDAINGEEPGLLGESGGHPYAAGVRVKGDVGRFRELFDSCCGRMSNGSGVNPREAVLDGCPTVEELSDGSARQLNEIPWGQEEFPKPRFEGEFTVRSVMPCRRGNGFFHELELDGTVVKAYHRREIGKPGTARRMSYSVSEDSYNCDMPFIHPTSAS